MKAEAELSDKEWRQMRRQMSKLDFDPVPETPALVPRSLYGDSDKELASVSEEQEDKPEESHECAALDKGSSNHDGSPKNRSCPEAVNQELPGKINKKVGDELPSTSMAVSPLITNRYRPREKKLPYKAELDDADIAVLEDQMAMAQEATRRSIMGAFMELRAKKSKSEALERTKLSAAHMSDVATLKSKMEELKMQVCEAEIERKHQDLLLDRFSEFTAKQLHRNHMRCSEDRSRDICFRLWSKAARQSAAKRNALRRVFGQSCKRQLLASFCIWKQKAQAFVLQNLLKDQRDRYEHRIVEMAKEYQLKIHQLQQEIEEAKYQVAQSQKCRQKLEEDLRLIFLRGVSAMNIEALTAFGSNHKVSHKLNAAQVNGPIKSKASLPSKDLATTPAPKELSPEIPLDESDPVPIAVTVRSSSVPVAHPNSSQVQASHTRVIGRGSQPTTTSGLYSAEMVRQHELSLPVGRQPASRSAVASYRPYSVPSPTRNKSASQSNVKYQVEMQYMRSTMAASAARGSDSTYTRPLSANRSSTRTHSTIAACRHSGITRVSQHPHRGMSRQQVGIEEQHPAPHVGLREDEFQEGFGRLNAEILNDGEEEDGIDLEGYEEYLERLKSKAAVRPCSARVVRPLSMETNADIPVPTRPARPVSARPRMRITPRGSSDDRALNGPQARTNGVGVRRKRQGERLVHARIRAVYNDVGRFSFPVKQVSAPYSVAPNRNSKSKGFQDAEVHDEYYRLLDAESELKAVCLQEQQKRVKAVAHARRLEEIISMKDKKIESLLNAKAVGADRTLSTSKSVIQREMADRDRQFHTLAQRLKQKIAQQSQLLSSYEEAMQSLRSGIRSTNLTELEEERSQLYQELRHHQELLGRQRLEWEAHQQKLVAFAEAEAINKLQIAKLQQENKVIAHEKRKLEQEVGFLKSRVELLQSNLSLEQRKRTYDREFSESVGKHTFSPPTQKVMLAQALEEMKKLMRRETVSSIRREKLKSPKSGTIPPRPDSYSSPSVTAFSTASATFSEPKTPRRATLTSPKPPRPSSAASTRSTSTTTHQMLQRTQQSFDNSHQEIKVGVLAANSFTASHGSLVPSVEDLRGQKNSRFGVQAELASTPHSETGAPTEQTGQEGTKLSQQDAAKVCAGECAEMQERFKQETSGPVCKGSNPEPDPGGGEQLLCTIANQAEPTADQGDDEEMESRQQQALAAVQSVLRLDVDDEFDSELSADLLDDAQHPMLRSDTESTITLAEAALDNDLQNAKTEAPLPLQASSVVEEGPREDPLDGGSQFSQSLDDLYPSDFLDTDAQASMGDEAEE